MDSSNQTSVRHHESKEQPMSTSAGISGKTSVPAKRKPASKNFQEVIEEVTRPMPASRRLFSRLIHLKLISAISDVVGATIARPNAILAGSIASFAFTLSAFLIAKNLGYNLSGFESIGAFIVGWMLGLAYDYLRIMITGKR